MYFFPLVTLVYSYSHIAWVLHRRLKQTAPTEGATRGNADARGSSDTATTNTKGRSELLYQKGRKNTIKTLLIVAITFVLFWTPSQINFFLYNLGYPVDLTADYYHVFTVLGFCNSCANPFIYAFQYEQFQKACRIFFMKMIGREPRESDMEASYTDNTHTTK